MMMSRKWHYCMLVFPALISFCSCDKSKDSSTDENKKELERKEQELRERELRVKEQMLEIKRKSIEEEKKKAENKRKQEERARKLRQEQKAEAERQRRAEEDKIKRAKRGFTQGSVVYLYSSNDHREFLASGTSHFVYTGQIQEYNSDITSARIKISRIERWWTPSLLGSKRPDPVCMPYTDDRDVEFPSPFGRFCSGDTIWVPMKNLFSDRQELVDKI